MKKFIYISILTLMTIALFKQSYSAETAKKDEISQTDKNQGVTTTITTTTTNTQKEDMRKNSLLEKAKETSKNIATDVKEGSEKIASKTKEIAMNVAEDIKHKTESIWDKIKGWWDKYILRKQETPDIKEEKK